jgi:hypothetical protein
MVRKIEKVVRKNFSNKKKVNRKTNYYCKICDYTTCKKADYTRHGVSNKHLKKVVLFEEKNAPPKTFSEKEKLKEENDYLKKKLDFMETAIIQLSKQSSTVNNTNCNNTITNNNNNTINIQLFLNENCKDALSLEEFIANVTFKVEDLLYESNNQLIKDGFATKLEKEILNTPVNERPIHVADNRRGIFHIKIKDDEEKATWVKDETSEKLLDSVQTARSKAYVASYDAITDYGNKTDLKTCLLKQKVQKELTVDSINKNKKLIKKLAQNLPNIKDDIKELDV